MANVAASRIDSILCSCIAQSVDVFNCHNNVDVDILSHSVSAFYCHY